MKLIKSLVLTLMLASVTYAGDMVQPLEPPPPPSGTAMTPSADTASIAIQEIVLTAITSVLQLR